MKLSVIGGGNMGSAIINVWLDKKLCKPSDLLLYEKHLEKQLPFLRRKIKVGEDYKLLKKMDVIVLAVKPQDLQSLLKEIQPFISPSTVIISIVAGVAIKTMASILGKVKIVRAMPNTPAQIGMGVTGWSANRRLSSKDKKLVKKILDTLGYAIYFSKESKLDVVTAISGSGPAYVFYFMEAFFESAYALGLNSSEATVLTLGTFFGATMLVDESGEAPIDLRYKVTSKKGTTEAAIKVFEKKKLKKIVLEATKKAFERAKELNQ